jgi:uncharacterized protein
MKITALYFYPVKSLAGIRVETLPLEAAGPRFDREWMVVGEDGKFVTQRELPKMQLLRTELTDGALILRAPGGKAARILFRKAPDALRPVEVWGTKVEGADEGAEAADFLSAELGRKLSLVRLGPGGRREGSPGARYDVRFADACPILLCSEDSLRELNARAGQELSAERFRPNVVIAGAPAFAEDGWPGFSVNNMYFKSIRACTRCAVTTVDPVTAARGPEPLKTLATFRKKGGKVAFGQYFLSPGAGELKVGMELRAEA